MNKQHTQLKFILLIVALLMGQLAALVHSVDHPFHETSTFCQIYFTLEQSGNSLVSDGLININQIVGSEIWVNFTFLLLPHLQTAYHIRAPPSLVI
ncbi:hypothetical protein QUF50_01770 [Thiotrichales bacterium HSG1]|nr:hypothetical protein [Thiotrichales bacterium HSG1]